MRVPTVDEPAPLQAYSVSYILNEAEVRIEDPKSCLKVYHDSDTLTGTTGLRHFCGNCGSPIYSLSPAFPNKIILKAPLFDAVSAPSTELFAEDRYVWLKRVESVSDERRKM
ncbi:hypothetical protein SLS57_005540 [Botryosphaeria dothidea]